MLSMNVLIADADVNVRKTLTRLFRLLSPRITTVEVENGKRALHALTENKFDFIVTELDMEGGSGEAFIGHLKSSRLLARKPIIIYSNRDFDDAGYENISHIHKEFTPLAELGTIIRELIFKYFICSSCEEAVNGESCGDHCFYKSLDPKWHEKLNSIK